MTFQELGARSEVDLRRMLIQAVAIISGQPSFSNKSPDEIFTFIAKQAAEIEAMS